MTVYCRTGLIISLILPVIVVGGLRTSAYAQTASVEDSELDCVIEARQMVELGSPEQGVVTEIAVDRGDFVRKGDVVARLDSELQALAVELARQRAESDIELQANAARLEYRRRAIDRIVKLHDKDVVSTKSRDEADVERRLALYSYLGAKLQQKIARSELELARARLERRTIRSPVDGVIVEVTMSPGELVHDQAQLMKIAVIDPLNVEVFAPVSLYGTIKRGMQAEVLPDKPVGGLYKARVAVVDPVLDTASGTFGLRLELPNSDHWIPAGLKCRVRILLDAQPHDGWEQPGDGSVREPADGGGTEGGGSASIAKPSGNRLAGVGGDAGRADLVFQVQGKLAKAGYDPGPPDGVLGPRTETAIRRFQQREGLEVDGRPSWRLLEIIHQKGSPTVTN